MAVERASRITGIGLAVALAMSAAGCGDKLVWEVWVTNETGREWYVRVPNWFNYDGAPLVKRVAPGAKGIVYRLDKEDPLELELLEPDCTVVGSFGEFEDGTYRVPGVENFTVRLDDSLRGANTPGIETVRACGGRL